MRRIRLERSFRAVAHAVKHIGFVLTINLEFTGGAWSRILLRIADVVRIANVPISVSVGTLHRIATVTQEFFKVDLAFLRLPVTFSLLKVIVRYGHQDLLFALFV